MLRACTVTCAAAAIAVAVHALPDLSSALIFDRAAIRSGELWRVFSGSWVHYSTEHLRNNVAAVAACGLMLGRRGPGLSLALLPLSSLAIGAGVFALRRDVERFAGLSGIACGLATYAAVSGVSRGGRQAFASWSLLAAVIGKILFELATGSSIFAGAAAPDEHPVLALSHLLGASAGVATGLWEHRDLVRRATRRDRR